MRITFILFLLIFSSFSSICQSYYAMVRPAWSLHWTYIDIEGNQVIEPQFRKCFPMTRDGVALVFNEKSNRYELLTVSGQLIEPESRIYDIKERNIYFGGHYDFMDGMLAAILRSGDWGFVDTKGKVAVEAKYEAVSIFNEGVAFGATGVDYKPKYFILDAHGNEKPLKIPKLKELKPFSEKRAIYYTKSREAGLINEKGEIVVEPKFRSLGYFSGGLAWAKTLDDKVGFIDKNGTWVIKPKYDMAKEYNAASDLALVKKGSEFMYVNAAGEELRIPDVEYYNNFAEGAAIGKRGEKYGFYATDGSWLIEPKLEGLRDFKNGIAAAKLNGLWGFIDKNGDWVLKPQFAAVKDFERVD